MKTLFNISQEAINLASKLEEGELTTDLEKSLSINQNELQEKAINYAYAIKSIESDVDTISQEIARLQALKKSKTNAIDRMKESVINAMQIYGIEKVTSPTLNLSIRRSESVEILMEAIIPVEYGTSKTVWTPNKTYIKNAIKNGEVVEGAVIKENYSLQIK